MRILVSKPDALGDQVLATGFIQALRRRWPEARIVWHVREGMEVIATLVTDTEVFVPDLSASAEQEAERLWRDTRAPLVLLPYPIHPFVDWTPDLPKRFAWWARFLAAATWDLAVAPVVNRTGLTDFTITASGATRRIAFAENGACQPMIEAAFAHVPGQRPSFTDEVPSSLHDSEGQQLERMLARVAPECRLETPVLVLTPAAHAEAQRLLGAATSPVLIAPGVGQNTQRAWPIVQLLRLASELRAEGHDIRWIEGPQDAAFFEGFPADESAARFRLDAKRPDVLAALLRSARLLVCNDTAYVHLAAALDLPTVAVFGAGQGGRFAPRFGRVSVVQGDPVCRNCQWQCAFPRHLCIQDVPYDVVRRAVATQLTDPAARHGRFELPLPGPESLARSAERMRDWYQEELCRLRWDGWARLQVIKDIGHRIEARDRTIAELSTQLNALGEQVRAQAAAAAAPRAVLPKLSVIIPMGRPERADGTLRSIEAQTLKPASWEVVVVGVGASQLLSKYPGLPLLPVDLPHNVLPPRTRAEGVARATGEWFLFVDDDVQLAPDFFEMLARILAVPPPAETAGQLPIGAIGVRLPGGRGTYFEHLTDISNFWSQQTPIRSVPHSIWYLYSAAIVVRAEAYRKSGGFNVDLPNGEDVDLTQRIKAAGYILAYEPSLVAYHHHGRDSLFRMWRYFWKNGNAAQYFFQHFGGVCCYSIRTVLTRTWLDLRMNRTFQKTQRVKLGLRVPWILINYLIVESSLEWHWQSYVWKAQRYRDLPARTESDRNAVRAFIALEQGRKLRGYARYALAMLQNLTDPVRR